MRIGIVVTNGLSVIPRNLSSPSTVVEYCMVVMITASVVEVSAMMTVVVVQMVATAEHHADEE